jgi:4a-hydroxytetrahydrobiopterin dehydratase
VREVRDDKGLEAAMALLDDTEVARNLEQVPGWERHGDAIERSVRLGDFRAAMGFVNTVAEVSEAAEHHPDILIRYNTVDLTLSTHSEGGLTEKDFALAARISELVP